MWKCKKCGERIEDNFEACWKCGTGKDGAPPLDQKVFEQQRESQAFLEKQEIFEEQERESEVLEEQEITIETKAKGKKTRYPALQTIAGMFRILAWFVVILGVIGIIFGFISLGGNKATGITLLLGSLVGGVIGCASLYAASELIEVFIDIEENTRLALLGMNRKNKK